VKGLAEVLAEHALDYRRDLVLATCECGWSEAFDESGMTGPAHLGTAVLDWVRERLAGAREDVARHFRFEGLLYATHTDRWLDDEWQQRLANTLADAALSAVAEALGVGEEQA